MTQPTDYQIAVAARMGRRWAKAGRDLAAMPYNALGSPAERVLAGRFVHAYNEAKDPDDISYDGDDE